MAIIYVKSTTGNNANSGATWALAKATLAGADAIDAAGDTIYVSQAHAESTAGAVTVVWSGTLANPTKIICVDDSAEPPTAVATTATVTTTGANGISVGGLGVYVYGITFAAGTGANAVGLNVSSTSSSRHMYEQCNFHANGTGVGSFIRVGVNAGTNMSCRWNNCNIKFTGASHVLSLSGRLHWNGGGVVSGGTTPTVLFSWQGASSGLLAENVDLSNFSAGVNLSNPPFTYAQAVIRDCKLPSSWSGTLLNGTFSVPGRVEMYNCSATAQNYRLWIEDYCGSVRDETTLVLTGGASDGVTPISWKAVSSANTVFPYHQLVLGEIVIWNDTTGSSKTVTVEILHDSATALNDDEIWIEVNELGSSAAPIGTLHSDSKADILAAAAAQTSSSVTWTTTGMSNPNKQKLSVTFTPNMKGWFLCRVLLAKASKTVYVDPKVVVS